MIPSTAGLEDSKSMELSMDDCVDKLTVLSITIHIQYSHALSLLRTPST